MWVLHGSHISGEAFVTSQRWPVRPEVEGGSRLPLGMLGVAPAWAGCGRHAFNSAATPWAWTNGGYASGSRTTQIRDVLGSLARDLAGREKPPTYDKISTRLKEVSRSSGERALDPFSAPLGIMSVV